MDQLRILIEKDCANRFAIGDLVITLKDNHGFKVCDIARHVTCSYPRLSQYHRTARAFTQEDRDLAIDFSFYEIARASSRRLNLDPRKLLNVIVRKRLTTTRKATAYFARKIREHKQRRALGTSNASVLRPGLIDRCIHKDYRRIINQFEDKSIKIIFADPPYPVPIGRHARQYGFSITARTESSNKSSKNALTVTLDLFERCLPKLAKDGCMILFQPGGVADHADILAAADHRGWTAAHALTWCKGKVKLGHADQAYSVASERLIIFCRQGDVLRNHDGSARTDILCFASMQWRAANGVDHHIFEKPPALCQFLIAKHSLPNDLVFEPFGCSGNLCIAAVESNRRFVYSETHHKNFKWGSSRIAQALVNLNHKQRVG